MEYHYEYSRELPVLTNQDIISGPSIPGGFDAYIHEIMGGDEIFGGSDFDVDDSNDIMIVGASDNYRIIRTASTVEPELKELFNYKRLPILPTKKPRRKQRKTKKSKKAKKASTSVRVSTSTSVRTNAKKRKRRGGVSSTDDSSNNVLDDLQDSDSEETDESSDDSTDSEESDESVADSPFNETLTARTSKVKDVKQYPCAVTGSLDTTDDNIADISFDEPKQDDYSIIDDLVN